MVSQPWRKSFNSKKGRSCTSAAASIITRIAIGKTEILWPIMEWGGRRSDPLNGKVP